MRKILPGLILFGVLALPLLVSAQAGPSECCKLSRNMSWTSGTVSGTACTTAVPCPLTKGDTIGPSGTTCAITNAVPDKTTEQWGLICIVNTLNTIVDWIFVVMVVLAVLFAILGAFQYLTSAGDPTKTKTGREYLLYAAIGLIVGLIARAIPGIVKSVIGY